MPGRFVSAHPTVLQFCGAVRIRSHLHLLMSGSDRHRRLRADRTQPRDDQRGGRGRDARAPLAAGAAVVRIVDAFLLHFPNLTVSTIDYAIAREAARLRARTSLKTPDALIIATALSAGIPIVVANDPKWADSRLVSPSARGRSRCVAGLYSPV